MPGKLETFVHDTIKFTGCAADTLYDCAARQLNPRSTPSPYASWPLHLPAHTNFITPEKVASVLGTPETLAAVRLGFRYLYDVAMYSDVPTSSARTTPRARITPAQGAAVLASGHFELVSDRTLVKGHIFLFAVPQPAKCRFRLVAHPAVQNDTLPTAPKVSFRSIHARKQLVFKGRLAAQADQKAYYPAFPMPADVGHYYCTRLPVPDEHGRTRWVLARLARAPTGLASQVFTGVAVSAHLKAFAIRSAGDDEHIDNYLFVDDDADNIVADLQELNARNNVAGGTLNEKEQIERDPHSLVASRIDWVGLCLDFEAKTVCCTSSLRDKVALAWSWLSNADSFSFRQFGALIGMLRYAAHLIDVPLASFFALNRYVSAVGVEMQARNDEAWDEPALVPEPAWRDLTAFTEIVLRNKPQPQQPDLLEPDVFVTVDACATGYGYAALVLRGAHAGAVLLHSERWSAADRQRYGDRWEASTFSEPHGVLRMKRHLLAALARRDAASSSSSSSSSSPPRRFFLVGSDSVTAIALFTKGYASKSFHMNEVAKADRADPALQRDQWVLTHIEGEKNVFADALSRASDEHVVEWEEAAVADGLRRLLGETASPADRSGGGSGALSIHPRTTTTTTSRASPSPLVSSK